MTGIWAFHPAFGEVAGAKNGRQGEYFQQDRAASHVARHVLHMSLLTTLAQGASVATQDTHGAQTAVQI